MANPRSKERDFSDLEGFWGWYRTTDERLEHFVGLVARGLAAESRTLIVPHSEATKNQPWLIAPPAGTTHTEAQTKEAQRLISDIFKEMV